MSSSSEGRHARCAGARRGGRRADTRVGVGARRSGTGGRKAGTAGMSLAVVRDSLREMTWSGLCNLGCGLDVDGEVGKCGGEEDGGRGGSVCA